MTRLFFLCLIIVSCGVRNPHSASGSTLTTTIACGNRDAPLDWVQYVGPLGKPVFDKIKMPSRYTIYQLNNEQLSAFFDRARQGQVQEITVPVNGTCRSYTLRESGTMSPELAAKFPEIQSYRGIGVEEKAEIASIDYDSKVLRIRVDTKEGSFVIEPYNLENGLFYLMYNIQDSGYPKVPFE